VVPTLLWADLLSRFVWIGWFQSAPRRDWIRDDYIQSGGTGGIGGLLRRATWCGPSTPPSILIAGGADDHDATPGSIPASAGPFLKRFILDLVIASLTEATCNMAARVSSVYCLCDVVIVGSSKAGNLSRWMDGLAWVHGDRGGSAGGHHLRERHHATLPSYRAGAHALAGELNDFLRRHGGSAHEFSFGITPPPRKSSWEPWALRHGRRLSARVSRHVIKKELHDAVMASVSS